MSRRRDAREADEVGAASARRRGSRCGRGRRRNAAPAFAGPLRYPGRWLAGDLSVVQWAHFVPRYNAWFRTWAEAWGEHNDVQVNVDLETYTLLPALAAAEVKAQRGHDIFGFLVSAGAIRGPGDRPRGDRPPGREAGRRCTATSGAGARTTRRRRSTSACRTSTFRRRSSGVTTSGTRSASRPRPGITCAKRRRR